MILLPPRALQAVAAVVTIAAVAAALYLHGRRAQALADKPKIEAAQDKAAVATLEAQGAAQTAQRVDVVVTQRAAAEKVASAALNAAEKAPDAKAPLDPARAARLLASDRELCRLSPDLVGCAAARDAGGGDEGVRPVRPPG